MDRYTINFDPKYVHPEEEPNLEELNSNIENINKDILFLDQSLIDTATKFNGLIDIAKLKIANIKELLYAERERQQDINILCNKYSTFSTVLNLKEENFTSNLSFESNIITAAKRSDIKVEYSIDAIDGNGYEGNNYVFLNDSFVEDAIRTSNRSYIKDNNLATAYEYSRITVNNETDAPSDFNRDSIEAECYITLSSEEYFNKINLNSERNDIILKEIYTSNDGLIYNLQREYNIAINNRDEIYNDNTYIYGSGIIEVPSTKYVKIVLKSNGYSDDVVAYKKVFYENTDGSSIKKIVKSSNAKRHVIKINEISLYSTSYVKGQAISKELITTPVNCIGFYCIEYLNKTYTLENNVTYFLIINGKEYEVVPINSNRNGKKIIRNSSQIYNAEHVTYLNEDIKSAKLKIVVNSPNSKITPYISDIKILIGGN